MKTLLSIVFLSLALMTVKGQTTPAKPNQIGDYKIPPNALAKDYCLKIDMTEFHDAKEIQEKYETFFAAKVEALRKPVYNFVKAKKFTKDDIIKFAKENKMELAWLFSLPLFCFLISCVCSPLLSCFKCCGKGCCKSKEKYESKFDLIKTIVMISVMLLSVILIAIGLFWAINMHKTIQATGNLACTIVTLFHDVQHGYVDTKITFAGIGGANFFLNNLKKETEKMKNSPELDSILNRDFAKAGTDLFASLSTFHTTYQAKKTLSCEEGSISQVTPGVIAALTTKINSPIEQETEKMVQVGKTLAETAKSIKEIASGSGPGAKIIDTLNTVTTKLDGYSKKIEDFKTKFMAKVDFPTVNKYLRMFLWIFTISIFSIVAINVLIMFCTLSLKKCLSMNCLSKMLMSAKCCLGGLISGASLTLMVVSVFFVNGCYYYDQFMDDRTMLKPLIPEAAFKIAETCLYKTGSGDASYLFGGGAGTGKPGMFDDLTKFGSIGEMTDMIKQYDSVTESVTMSKYKTDYLEKLKSFEIVEKLPGSADFKSNLNVLDQKAHGIEPKDEFVLNEASCPSGYQKSKATDNINEAKGTNYCITIPTYPFPQIGARYVPKTTANAAFDSLKKCTASYSALVQQMIVSLNQGPLLESKNYLVKVKASATDVQTVVTKLKNTASFLKKMQGNVMKMFDCRILRKELDMVRKSLCDKGTGFGTKFALQAYLLSIIGPLMSFLGFCLCCQTRIADRDKDKKPHSDKAKDKKRRRGKGGVEMNTLEL